MKHLTDLTLISRARGVSLIEGVLFLVISLAVLVGGTVLFRQSDDKRQVSDMASAMTLVSVAAERIEMNGGTYYTLEDGAYYFEMGQHLARSGSIPENLIGADGGLVSPWGGEIGIWSTRGVDAEGEEFMTILTAIYDMPTAICVALGTMDEAGNTAMGAYDAMLVKAWGEDAQASYAGSLTEGEIIQQWIGSDVPPEELAPACEQGDGLLLQRIVFMR